MLEATIDNGSQDFRLQEEIAEARAVDRDVSSLHVLLLVAGLCHNLIGLLLILVVEKIIVIGHNFNWFCWLFNCGVQEERYEHIFSMVWSERDGDTAK